MHNFAPSFSALLHKYCEKVTFELKCNFLFLFYIYIISASYVDAAQGGTSVVKTPANVAQYVVLSDTQMKVYLNLDAIIANVKRLGSSTKAIDMSEILSQAVTSLLPLVTDGVPLTYVKNEGK